LTSPTNNDEPDGFIDDTPAPQSSPTPTKKRSFGSGLLEGVRRMALSTKSKDKETEKGEGDHAQDDQV
jgi:hypothetical protein